MLHRIHVLFFIVAFTVSFPQFVKAGDVSGCNQTKNAKLAITSCGEIISSGNFIGKSLAAAYLNRGMAYDDLNELDHALKDFKIAVIIDPNLGTAYRMIGHIYKKKGDKKRAIEEYSKAIDKDKGKLSTWLAYTSRSAVYCELGNGYASFKDEIFSQLSNPSTIKTAKKNLKNLGYFNGAIDDEMTPEYLESYKKLMIAVCK